LCKAQNLKVVQRSIFNKVVCAKSELKKAGAGAAAAAAAGTDKTELQQTHTIS